jgi:hypothetical protein
MSKLIKRDGVGAAGIIVIDAAAEALMVDVEDLTNVVIWAIQTTDAGTATLPVEISPDGTTWVAFGADLTEASFAAGAGTAVQRSVSDANAMPLAIKQVRLRASALAGGGAYGLKVTGFQRTTPR